jgi:hypothetical protein
MKPIYLDFIHLGGTWSTLLYPDQGRCDVWRDQVFVGSVAFSRDDGFTVTAQTLREILPTLVEQFRPYYPLLRHEGSITARSDRLMAMASSA